MSREFVVVHPSSAEQEQQPQQSQQLLLAIPSHALSEANQTNAALPQLIQLQPQPHHQPSAQPQPHHQPSATLCPIAMTEDILQCHAQCPDQVLLGEDHNTDNIFFATNESYIYEYLQQSDNINSQSPPPIILYNLIDCFVDEVRGEIKAEQDILPQNSSPTEFKYANSFIELPSSSTRISSTSSDPSSSPPNSFYYPTFSYIETINESDSATITTSSSSSTFNASPSETASSSSSSSSSVSPNLSDNSHGKKYSLFGMTYEEVNDRKREQNKNAARKYRAKKQKELETNKYEISRLEKRNTELRDMEKFLADQIAFYKEMMISKVNS